MNNAILVINSGSSSIKFSLIHQNQLNFMYRGEVENILDSPCLTIWNTAHTKILKKNIPTRGHEAALKFFFDWLENLSEKITLEAVGHRVVHGGQYFLESVIVTDDVIQKMAKLISLAPLHQPYNIEAINIIKNKHPKLKQIACFDTTFHHTQEKLAKLFAIPKYLTDDGIIRYGFHGISYEYIASVIEKYIGEKGNERVVVAHLGNGASICAMYQRKSVATSMGFTALDGLMMGTRCGRIDPGVIFYLMREKKYSEKQIENLLYNESGLLGVSNIHYDMRTLLSHSDINAAEAIELFCYRAALEFGSSAVALGGCDAFVFTAGIGENSFIIRKKICEKLSWLGITLNDKANENNETIISSPHSKIIVAVIPTNEEYMIAKHVQEKITP